MFKLWKNFPRFLRNLKKNFEEIKEFLNKFEQNFEEMISVIEILKKVRKKFHET